MSTRKSVCCAGKNDQEKEGTVIRKSKGCRCYRIFKSASSRSSEVIEMCQSENRKSGTVKATLAQESKEMDRKVKTGRRSGRAVHLVALLKENGERSCIICDETERCAAE